MRIVGEYPHDYDYTQLLNLQSKGESLSRRRFTTDEYVALYQTLYDSTPKVLRMSIAGRVPQVLMPV